MTASILLEEERSVGGIPVGNAADGPRTYRCCFPPVVHFGDAQGEYLAVQRSAAVIDVSDRAQIEMRGKDARAFLHNFCTNDIKGLAAGNGCEAFVTNVKGRILAHVFVFTGDTSVWIEAGPGEEAKLLTHLDRFLFSEDVQMRGRTDEYGELLLTGPASAERLSLLGVSAHALEPLQHAWYPRDGVGLFVRRADLLGHCGFLLSAERGNLIALWRELVSAGIRPCGAEAFHACRIEAGFPLYGLDLSEDSLAQEAARTERAISFTKGCYLGQEPIARIDALGHVNRQLCRMRLDATTAPEAGDVVLADDQQQVGAITSSARVPGEPHSVALAYLRTGCSKPGTPLMVGTGQGQMSGLVF